MLLRAGKQVTINVGSLIDVNDIAPRCHCKGAELQQVIATVVCARCSDGQAGIGPNNLYQASCSLPSWQMGHLSQASIQFGVTCSIQLPLSVKSWRRHACLLHFTVFAPSTSDVYATATYWCIDGYIMVLLTTGLEGHHN